MSFTYPVTFASGGAQLDRAAHLRTSTRRLLRDASARLLPFWDGRPMIAMGDGWRHLGWVPPLPQTLQMAAEEPIFLGLYEDTPCFAADYSHHDRERLQQKFIAGAKFVDLRQIAGEIPAGDAAVAATAKGVLGWHMTHRFCSVCGAPTEIAEGGWKRICTECGAQHFPRIDPVVIMLVTRGDRVLLGRQDAFPEGLYSLIAGFMEPGEAIEDAVRRETLEEVGIKVGRVRYLACQPWPFPSALMLGCAAEALNDEIAVDTQELEDALWLPKSELPDVLAGKHTRLAAPRVSAIARVLLSAWAAGDIEGF
ncbi:MAG: NAD(+) diphosphatase [Pseudomonadota bacterium]